jgi:mannitol 2-dehydrogenase
LLPVVRENLTAGRPVTLSAAIVASWARYAEAVDEQGQPIDVVDRMADELTAVARTQDAEPLAFVSNRAVFGDLVDDPRFTDPYLWTLQSLHSRGATKTLEALEISRKPGG